MVAILKSQAMLVCAPLLLHPGGGEPQGPGAARLWGLTGLGAVGGSWGQLKGFQGF